MSLKFESSTIYPLIGLSDGLTLPPGVSTIPDIAGVREEGGGGMKMVLVFFCTECLPGGPLGLGLGREDNRIGGDRSIRSGIKDKGGGRGGVKEEDDNKEYDDGGTL